MNARESQGSAAEGRRKARVTREFGFPRETVFRMFTDPTKSVKWFGTPEGATLDRFELDVRPGGAIVLHDRQAEGSLHRTTGRFVEVVEPERISFRTSTILEEGAAPFEALQTVTLEAVGPKRTRMVVVVDVLSAVGFPGGVGSLVEGFEGGWGQSLDKLERALS